MLKSELIIALKKKYPELKAIQLNSIIDIFSNYIIKGLINGKSVEFRNFGTWSTKKIKPKFNARNPKTGEVMYIPEKKKTYFKMSKQLRKKINEKE